MSERCETPNSERRLTSNKSASSEVMKRLTPWREKRWRSEHVLAEPGLVRRSVLEIREGVDENAPHAAALYRLEQVVDPLVDVEVDRRAVHQIDALLVERPAEPRDDPRELNRVLPASRQ